MRIAVAGTGYVGLSNSMLLAQHNEVIALDIVPEKVSLLNHRQSPIVDSDISAFLQRDDLNFKCQGSFYRGGFRHYFDADKL